MVKGVQPRCNDTTHMSILLAQNCSTTTNWYSVYNTDVFLKRFVIYNEYIMYR